jgi:hypothetical protein
MHARPALPACRGSEFEIASREVVERTSDPNADEEDACSSDYDARLRALGVAKMDEPGQVRAGTDRISNRLSASYIKRPR